MGYRRNYRKIVIVNVAELSLRTRDYKSKDNLKQLDSLGKQTEEEKKWCNGQ